MFRSAPCTHVPPFSPTNSFRIVPIYYLLKFIYFTLFLVGCEKYMKNNNRKVITNKNNVCYRSVFKIFTNEAEKNSNI